MQTVETCRAAHLNNHSTRHSATRQEVSEKGASTCTSRSSATLSDMGDTSNLTPFTKGDPRAVAAGKASAATRAANRDSRVKAARQAAAQLVTFNESYQRGNLGANAANVAQFILGRIGTGDIPVRNGDEAAALLRALVDIARLEEGQATSHTLTATLSAADAVQRVVLLQQAARLELQSTRAAGDGEDATAQAVAPHPIEAVSTMGWGGQ